MAKPADVQIVEPIEGNVIAPTRFEMWKDNIEARARQSARDENKNNSVMREQAEAVLAADNLDDALDALDGGLVNGQNMLNVPLEIHGYTLDVPNPDFLGGDLDVYVHMDCTVLASGESDYSPGDEVVINVGGLLVVTPLEKIREFNAFPFRGILRPAGRAIKLKKLPPSTVVQ
jgi:hypothetical protein